MNKKLTSYLAIVMIAIFVGGCLNKTTTNSTVNTENNQTKPISLDYKEKESTAYLGGEYKGNYVWGGAMNLAWNELNDNILHDKLRLATNDKVILGMVECFNHSIFTKNDLDEESYYIKSGYGQETVKTINKESRKKFPDKRFEDLALTLSPKDIISYAYFLKKVEYLNTFDKKPITFEGKKVEGFHAESETQKKTLRIWNYESQDKFILSIELKGGKDQLFLAKGFDMSQPNEALKGLSEAKTSTLMETKDIFEAPVIHLSHHRKYNELLRIHLQNPGFEEYFISEMFENINFDMDEKGARVENEGVIGMTKGVMPDPDNIKKLVLDKPYWVIMKRTSSANPYFILGIKNTEVMKLNQ